MKKNFSFFSGGIKTTIPHADYCLSVIYNVLISDKYKNQIIAIREATDKKKQSNLKSKLDYVTFSGRFTDRKAAGLIEHSGLIWDRKSVV